jgi:protein tyrosine phosphatase (PTP) superfamily phosphohydrolase (DUF442 family)
MPARLLGWSDRTTGTGTRWLRPARWLMRGFTIGGSAVAAIAATVGIYWGVVQYDGNLHAVQGGVVYRSAQLSAAATRSAVERYGIKSVLNLRGAHHGSDWYDAEIKTAGELGLAHYDYPMSSKHFVGAERIAAILEIVRGAPKPLLIHCKSGADRTGLVAALYRYAEGGASATEADRELSLAYGHFPYLTSRSGAMDDSFWAYVRANPGGGGR